MITMSKLKKKLFRCKTIKIVLGVGLLLVAGTITFSILKISNPGAVKTIESGISLIVALGSGAYSGFIVRG